MSAEQKGLLHALNIFNVGHLFMIVPVNQFSLEHNLHILKSHRVKAKLSDEWNRWVKERESITITVWNHKKLPNSGASKRTRDRQPLDAGAFLGCSRLSTLQIDALRDTGCMLAFFYGLATFDFDFSH